MIAYLFLAIGGTGTAAVAYYVTPRSAHRYVVPRSVLRAEAARSTAAADELACKLIGLAAEFDAVSAERDDLKAVLDKAGLRIADLEERVRDRDQLEARVRALAAELANVRKVSQLPAHGDTPPPGVHGLPARWEAFALSPAPKPS
ncbi:hypothetical protein [Streptomyces bungoensis]|uniref:hypothetical protein n=1 Tax=Streptomyces bungoensis TaxID=285568 RepID=UPI003414F740